jgi:hypothetical protein
MGVTSDLKKVCWESQSHFDLFWFWFFPLDGVLRNMVDCGGEVGYES